MIPNERIKRLNSMDIVDRPYVLYWMQSAQRAECNHALEYAVRQANALRKPLMVVAIITEDFPEANEKALSVYAGRATGNKRHACQTRNPDVH